jgi:PAS domain S-box-containing protein
MLTHHELRELQESESRLSRAQALAHVGDWEWDVVTNVVKWSAEMYRIYGFKPFEIEPDYSLVLQQMHPESKDEFLKAIESALTKDQPFEMNYTFYRKDGSVAILHTIGSVERNNEGAPVRMAGIVQDITKQKHDEDLIRSSEERFRTIFDSVLDGILIADISTMGFIEGNNAICKMLGYTRSELLTLSVMDIHPAETWSEVKDVFARQLKGEFALAKNLPIKRKDGTVFYADVNSKSTQMHNITCMIGIFRDISERKRAEEVRQENLLFIDSLLKNAPIGIRVFDGETGACILANQTSADIVGGDIEAMKSQNFRELDSWHASGLLEVAEAVLTDGHARTVETNMLNPFGKQVTVTSIVSKFVVAGKPHLLIIGHDITVEKQLADKNRKIEAQMLHAQKLESLGVLAGGIAHDFNNILLAILGNAELALLRLIPESPAINNLKQIELAAQRAADLAQQMLAYSGKGQIVVEGLDINSLITEMNHILEVSISKKVLIRLNLAKRLPLFEGDATQIRQIIMNLVINASEAIGEVDGHIIVTTGSKDCDQAYLSKIWQYDELQEGTYIYFEIADTGCGMNRETLAKIFDPFFTTKFTGRGLGMAAVLGIIRGHHGAITVYSEPGKGTSFKVFLPAKHDIPKISKQKSALDIPPKGSGTVLLVDDEATILALGKEMLEELGYTVLAAEDGVVAVEIFKHHKEEITCVILDLTMPRMDGEQTFRSLRSIDPNILVIMSSGYNEQEVTQKLIGRGLAGFIQKPYNLLELGRKLKEVVMV